MFTCQMYGEFNQWTAKALPCLENKKNISKITFLYMQKLLRNENPLENTCVVFRTSPQNTEWLLYLF